MKHKVEYSMIVREKMKVLRKNLSDRFGTEVAQKSIKAITTSLKQLSDYPLKGMAVSDAFGVDTDFRYLYVRKNYFFYYLDKDSVIVAEMFDEREDFMIKLFGISSTTEESLRFWGE